MNNLSASVACLRERYPNVAENEIQTLLEYYQGDTKRVIETIEHYQETTNTPESLVQLCSEYNSECNFCPGSSPKGRIVYGMNAEKLKVKDYQNLIDHGWRRSGSWVYHPSNHKSCCPNYTIRLDVKKFKSSKSQKRCMKRWKRFLAGEIMEPQYRMDIEEDGNQKALERKSLKESQKREIESVLFEAVKQALESISVEHILAVKNSRIRPQVSEILHKKKRGRLKSYLTTNFCLQFTPYAPNSQQYSPLMVAKRIIKYLPYHWNAHAAAPGFINFKAPVLSSSLSVIGNDKNEKNFNYEEGLDNHHFEVVMDEGNFTDEKYQLYKKYQIEIHNDKESDLTESSFRNFLCTSPLIREYAKSKEEPECGFGSFHQCYRLDGELIAVGVVDILPSCLSSVYFFYNPRYSWLSPGVISALGEINWVKNFARNSPTSKFHYYYMGYYIHDCPKMKYKKSYQPSDLLCPFTYKWVPLKRVESLLDEQKYCRFSNEPEFPSLTAQQVDDIICRVNLFISGSVVTIKDLTPESQKTVRKLLEEFILIVGVAASNFQFLFK